MNTPSQAMKAKFASRVALLTTATVAYAALVIFGVFSTSRKIEASRSELETLNANLQAQRSLQPIEALLQSSKKQLVPKGINAYEREPLEIKDLAFLPTLFEGLAREAGIELVSATPQARSLQDGRAMLRVDTRMRGNFKTFIILLNKLVEMQFVESIDSLGIDVTEVGQDLKLSVWLSIQ